LKTSSFVEEALQLMHLRVMKAEEDMNQQGEPQQQKYSLKLSRKSVVLLKFHVPLSAM
jgi:hypothetical protein